MKTKDFTRLTTRIGHPCIFMKQDGNAFIATHIHSHMHTYFFTTDSQEDGEKIFNVGCYS